MFQFISFSEQNEKLMARKEELDRGYKKIQVGIDSIILLNREIKVSYVEKSIKC